MQEKRSSVYTSFGTNGSCSQCKSIDLRMASGEDHVRISLLTSARNRQTIAVYLGSMREVSTYLAFLYALIMVTSSNHSEFDIHGIGDVVMFEKQMSSTSTLTRTAWKKQFPSPGVCSRSINRVASSSGDIGMERLL